MAADSGKHWEKVPGIQADNKFELEAALPYRELLLEFRMLVGEQMGLSHFDYKDSSFDSYYSKMRVVAYSWIGHECYSPCYFPRVQMTLFFIPYSSSKHELFWQNYFP